VKSHEISHQSVVCILDTTLDQIRDHVGLETDLLAAYYTLEKQRYPDARGSQRLLS